MGQSLSLYLPFGSNKPITDLSLQTRENFGKRVVLVILKPFYIVNKSEFDNNLDSGNDALNMLIEKRISADHTNIKDIFSEYNILDYLYIDNKIYITIENADRYIFTIFDCQRIRNKLDGYNNNMSISTRNILSVDEANESPFYEDLGPLELGINVTEINYL